MSEVCAELPKEKTRILCESLFYLGIPKLLFSHKPPQELRGITIVLTQNTSYAHLKYVKPVMVAAVAEETANTVFHMFPLHWEKGQIRECVV
jgi:hypothetical protein